MDKHHYRSIFYEIETWYLLYTYLCGKIGNASDYCAWELGCVPATKHRGLLITCPNNLILLSCLVISLCTKPRATNI